MQYRQFLFMILLFVLVQNTYAACKDFLTSASIDIDSISDPALRELMNVPPLGGNENLYRKTVKAYWDMLSAIENGQPTPFLFRSQQETIERLITATEQTLSQLSSEIKPIDEVSPLILARRSGGRLPLEWADAPTPPEYKFEGHDKAQIKVYSEKLDEWKQERSEMPQEVAHIEFVFKTEVFELRQHVVQHALNLVTAVKIKINKQLSTGHLPYNEIFGLFTIWKKLQAIAVEKHISATRYTNRSKFERSITSLKSFLGINENREYLSSNDKKNLEKSSLARLLIIDDFIEKKDDPANAVMISILPVFYVPIFAAEMSSITSFQLGQDMLALSKVREDNWQSEFFEAQKVAQPNGTQEITELSLIAKLRAEILRRHRTLIKASRIVQQFNDPDLSRHFVETVYSLYRHKEHGPLYGLQGGVENENWFFKDLTLLVSSVVESSIDSEDSKLLSNSEKLIGFDDE